MTLEFPDNALLSGLSGSHQKNFVRLEQKLDVRIATRGNLVAVEGSPEMRERAASVLRALYARLEAGEALRDAGRADRALSPRSLDKEDHRARGATPHSSPQREGGP